MFIGDYGAYVSSVPSSGSYDATFLMNNVYASYNDSYGLYFAYDAAYGRANDAAAILRNITTTYNGGYGIYFDYDAVRAYADATLVIAGLDSSYNGLYGLYIGDNGAYSMDTGDALFVLHDANFYSNDASGFMIDSGALAYAVYGNATASISNLYTAYNGVYGFSVNGYGAYALDGGDAWITLRNAEAYANGTDGFYFTESRRASLRRGL